LSQDIVITYLFGKKAVEKADSSWRSAGVAIPVERLILRVVHNEMTCAGAAWIYAPVRSVRDVFRVLTKKNRGP
jgi:hypothetical protein